MRHCLLIIGFIFLNSCGESKNQGSNVTKFSYDYEINGCKTGKHEFSSKEEYCKALTNAELNNYCAISMRENAYNRNCK